MREIFEELNASFTRTLLPLCEPILIHCTAGSGKSTFIRRLLRLHPSVHAFTTGTADPVNLSGAYIKKWKPSSLPEGFVILDEYLGTLDRTGALFCFADPQQYQLETAQAHFVCTFSHRVPRPVSVFASGLGFDIQSSRPGKLTIADLYSFEPIGVIIAFEKSVIELLRAHSADFVESCSALGLEYPTVTVCLSDHPSSLGPSAQLYVSLTRASEHLVLLYPDAPLSSSQ